MKVHSEINDKGVIFLYEYDLVLFYKKGDMYLQNYKKTCIIKLALCQF